MENDQSSDENIIEPASTAPPSFSVQARGVDDTETATKVATLVGTIVRELGRHIGLQALDGVTVAFDYDQALLDLDRGYESSHQLRATNSHVFGVAMTPSVIRDGELKSHILVRAPILLPLFDDADEEGIRTAIHVLAHECGHVEVTRQFDQCFPGVILRGQLPLLDTLRWNTIFAVWDEYAVTWISAPFGPRGPFSFAVSSSVAESFKDIGFGWQSGRSHNQASRGSDQNRPVISYTFPLF
jgi:hypothetical protein